MRVYTVLYTRKTAVKDAAGAAQRAKILDGRIFPSPAPRKVPERGFFTWSGSRRKNPRRKLPLTKRGFGSGCILYSTPAKRQSRTRQRRLCRSEILDGRIFPSPAPHSKKRWLFGHLFLPQINETKQPYSGIPSPSQFPLILQLF